MLFGNEFHIHYLVRSSEVAMQHFNTLIDIEARNGIRINLVECSSSCIRCFKVDYQSAEIGCSYCISGNMICSYRKENFINQVTSNQCGIWGVPAVSIDVQLGKGTHRWLSVQADRALIEQILDDNEISFNNKMKHMLLNCDKPFSCISINNQIPSMIVKQILNCPFCGVMRRHYIECKGMELLLQELERHLVIHQRSANCPINRFKVEEAWRQLSENLESPLTIYELASAVGMSESTLKRSFRRIYGTSIFNFFQNYRMVQARKMLEEGEYNVTEVAFKVGYANLSHFSRAFHKHFGYSPKAARAGLYV